MTYSIDIARKKTIIKLNKIYFR